MGFGGPDSPLARRQDVASTRGRGLPLGGGALPRRDNIGHKRTLATGDQMPSVRLSAIRQDGLATRFRTPLLASITEICGQAGGIGRYYRVMRLAEM